MSTAASDRSKPVRRLRESGKANACLLSLRFAGREMNPHAPVRKHPPALRSDHHLSGYLLPHHRQGHAAPSVIGKVWMPSPQPLRGCMPAEQVGSWGPQTGKVLVERRGCLEPRPHLTQPCTPDAARLAPQQRPRSSSSSAFSRNLRASYNLDLVSAACEASSQRVWGTKAKAGCILAAPAPWLRCLTRGEAPL